MRVVERFAREPATVDAMDGAHVTAQQPARLTFETPGQQRSRAVREMDELRGWTHAPAPIGGPEPSPLGGMKVRRGRALFPEALPLVVRSGLDSNDVRGHAAPSSKYRSSSPRRPHQHPAFSLSPGFITPDGTHIYHAPPSTRIVIATPFHPTHHGSATLASCPPFRHSR